MAKYASPALLDGGLAYLKANAAKLVLLKAYAAGDSAATIATNNIGEVAVASADYTLSANGSGRQVTVAAKTITAASANSGATPNLHVAHVDAGGVAIYVADETSDQVITSGNPVDIPAHSYTVNQPT